YTGLPTLSGVTAWNPLWTPATTYSVGQVVAWNPAFANANTGYGPVSHGLQYMCVSAGTSGGATDQPFRNSDPPTNNWAPSLNAPTLVAEAAPGTAQWVAQSPVSAIQITVKYLDPSQNLLRQVTIVQTFTLP